MINSIRFSELHLFGFVIHSGNNDARYASSLLRRVNYV